METGTNKSESESIRPARGVRMNAAKSRAISQERRLRDAAAWETTQGNRRKTNPDEVFEQARRFRRLIELEEFANLEELETFVFGRWGLDMKP